MMDASQIGNCCGVEGGGNRVALSSGCYKLLRDSPYVLLASSITLKMMYPNSLSGGLTTNNGEVVEEERKLL